MAEADLCQCGSGGRGVLGDHRELDLVAVASQRFEKLFGVRRRPEKRPTDLVVNARIAFFGARGFLVGELAADDGPQDVPGQRGLGVGADDCLRCELGQVFLGEDRGREGPRHRGDGLFARQKGTQMQENHARRQWPVLVDSSGFGRRLGF